MKENELKGMDEVLVHDVGETEPEFTNDGKSKKIKRLIVFSIILIVIVAIVVTVILLVRDKDEDKDNTTILMDDDDFIKPNNTNKKYQLIELEKSKYKFILVHDPYTANGGIEIKTNFGCNSEVIDGFAHYAEHIFFGGTKKISEYELFNIVSQFGEFINAYTSDEETVFQYFGSIYAFETLLKYISSIIKEPLLNKTFLVSEIDVVTSEYDGGNVTIGNWLEILMENSNPEHGFSQTITSHTGNKETLGKYNSTILSEYLSDYYKVLFNQSNCFFILYSSKSLKDMRKYAQKYFDFKLDEPTNDDFKAIFEKKVRQLDNPVFLEGQLGKIVTTSESADASMLSFFIQFSQKNGYIQSDKVLKNLLSHKENGSFFKFLIDKNYASFCVIDEVGYFKNYNYGLVLIYLTQNGLDNIDNIIEGFFASINAIKKEDDKLEEILNDLKTKDMQYYQNKEEKDTQFPDDIDNIAQNYHFFGEKYILGNPIDINYKKSRVKEILDEIIPENSYIFIDTKQKIESKYIKDQNINYTRNYKSQYKINSIPEEFLENLKTKTEVDDYKFQLKSKNKYYTKLSGLTEKPCYEIGGSCKNNEYNPKKDDDYEPYKIDIKNKNVESFVKIDRSHGSPFVNGYIRLDLDKDLFKNLINTDEQKALFALMKYSLDFNFHYSPLYEGMNRITLIPELESDFTITFSTFNDILDDVINYIIDFFTNPIDETIFNTVKEYYYIEIAESSEESKNDIMPDTVKIFSKFITVNTYESYEFPIEYAMNAKYSDYLKMFSEITKIIKKLKYLTQGDISVNKATNTTELLSSLIKETEINLLLAQPKEVELPIKTSILFSTKSSNIYQRQGATLVMYEFDEAILDYVYLYSLCGSTYLFDYIRTKKGSGYTVAMVPAQVLDKYYLLIYSLGKVYSPEKMDRFINEGIKESFSTNKCNIDLILKHLQKKAELLSYFAEYKFEYLIESLLQKEVDIKILKDVKLRGSSLSYKDIVEVIKELVIEKPKRISILYHRGDIKDEELEDQKKEIDKKYYLNEKIENVVTENIEYLKNYTKYY